MILVLGLIYITYRICKRIFFPAIPPTTGDTPAPTTTPTPTSPLPPPPTPTQQQPWNAPAPWNLWNPQPVDYKPVDYNRLPVDYNRLQREVFSGQGERINYPDPTEEDHNYSQRKQEIQEEPQTEQEPRDNLTFTVSDEKTQGDIEG